MDWTEIGVEALPFVAKLLEVVVLAIIAVAGRRWLNQRTTACLVELARDAIARAEQWGTQRLKSGEAPEKGGKMKEAVRFWFAEAKRRKLPQWTQEQVEDYLEAQLGRWELFDEEGRR